MSAPPPESMEAGVQPIDDLLTRHRLSNHDVVAGSPRALTHKMVRKARNGRKLTVHSQGRVLDAVRTVLEDPGIQLDDLFTYRGR